MKGELFWLSGASPLWFCGAVYAGRAPQLYRAMGWDVLWMSKINDPQQRRRNRKEGWGRGARAPRLSWGSVLGEPPPLFPIFGNFIRHRASNIPLWYRDTLPIPSWKHYTVPFALSCQIWSLYKSNGMGCLKRGIFGLEVSPFLGSWVM